jgi:hypothetical protein
MGARWGWRRAIGGAAGLTRMAWHRRGQKTGPAVAASTSTAIFGEHRRRLKAPRTPGSPGGGEGQDQSTGRGSEVALTEGRGRSCGDDYESGDGSDAPAAGDGDSPVAGGGQDVEGEGGGGHSVPEKEGGGGERAAAIGDSPFVAVQQRWGTNRRRCHTATRGPGGVR